MLKLKSSENAILKLLGTEYSLSIQLDPNDMVYLVTVCDRNGNARKRKFSALEAQISKIDVLLYTIEQCILGLK